MLAPVTYNGHLYPTFELRGLPGTACSLYLYRGTDPVVLNNPLKLAFMPTIANDGKSHLQFLTQGWKDYQWLYSATDVAWMTGSCTDDKTTSPTFLLGFLWTDQGAVMQ